MFKLLIIVLLSSFMAFMVRPTFAIETDNFTSTPTENKLGNETEIAIKKWQAMRFGLFIHFGAYADLAGIWQGKQIEKLGEQIQRHADISAMEYQAIVRQFNPSNFDADAIAKLAKQAGMRYIVLTTKHHDGFAMFDSKHTDFDIVDFTPYKKDLLKELSEATKRHGLKLGLYYSTPDWHFNGPNPERNPIDGKISVFSKVSKANEDYQVAQLEELMTNYGDIVEVFFDMGEPTLKQSKRFRDVVKKYQPNALINGRVMNNQGDFLTMPDNHVPDSPILNYPWETPGTFYHTWGYKSWVKGLPLDEQIGVQVRKLSNIASMGGNFLLNIGPKGDGSILPYESNVLVGVGQWLDKNKAAIFETGVNPFLKLDWGQVSTSENALYLHIHHWPKDNQLLLPGLINKISQVTLLTDSHKQLLVHQAKGDTKIDLSSIKKDPYLTILKLDYQGQLQIIPRHTKVNENGVINLAGEQATKQGKFGKESYRSMLKDFSRSWYVDIPVAGRYQVRINYKLPYKEKDFILKSVNDELTFKLKGKEHKGHTSQQFDGNELALQLERNLVKSHKNVAGELYFSHAGIQKVTFKQGQNFDLKTSIQAFKAQDQRYRAMNIELESIELFLPNQ